MTISVRIGDEYDATIRKALTHALRELGSKEVEKSWGVAGSQELETLRVEVDGHSLTVESETYIGLTIEGDAEIVGKIHDRIRKIVRG